MIKHPVTLHNNRRNILLHSLARASSIAKTSYRRLHGIREIRRSGITGKDLGNSPIKTQRTTRLKSTREGSYDIGKRERLYDNIILSRISAQWETQGRHTEGNFVTARLLNPLSDSLSHD